MFSASVACRDHAVKNTWVAGTSARVAVNDSAERRSAERQVTPVREDLEQVEPMLEQDLPDEVRGQPEAQEVRRFASSQLVELDRLRVRDARRRRRAADLCVAHQPAVVMGQQRDLIGAGQLARLLRDAVGGGEMGRHVLRPVVGGERLGEGARRECGQIGGVFDDPAPDLPSGPDGHLAAFLRA